MLEAESLVMTAVMLMLMILTTMMTLTTVTTTLFGLCLRWC